MFQRIIRKHHSSSPTGLQLLCTRSVSDVKYGKWPYKVYHLPTQDNDKYFEERKKLLSDIDIKLIKALDAKDYDMIDRILQSGRKISSECVNGVGRVRTNLIYCRQYVKQNTQCHIDKLVGKSVFTPRFERRRNKSPAGIDAVLTETVDVCNWSYLQELLKSGYRWTKLGPDTAKKLATINGHYESSKVSRRIVTSFCPLDTNVIITAILEDHGYHEMIDSDDLDLFDW